MSVYRYNIYKITMYQGLLNFNLEIDRVVIALIRTLFVSATSHIVYRITYSIGVHMNYNSDSVFY